MKLGAKPSLASTLVVLTDPSGNPLEGGALMRVARSIVRAVSFTATVCLVSTTAGGMAVSSREITGAWKTSSAAVARGTRESQVALPSGFTDVTCHVPSTCLVAGRAGAGSFSVFTATRNDMSWRHRSSANATLWAASCGSSTECAAAAQVAHPAGPAVLWSTNAGFSWQVRALPVSVGTPFAISCPSARICVVTGSSQTRKYMATATDDAGKAWTSVVLPLPMNLGVTCPSVSVCYAPAYEPTRTDGGQVAVMLRLALSGSRLRIRRRMPLAYLSEISGFVCSSSKRCVGIGTHDTALGHGSWRLHFASVFTSDGGAKWQFGSGPGLFGGWSISCPSALVCVAVGSGDSSFPGRDALWTDNGGRTWATAAFSAQSPYVSLLAASCLSPVLCVAVGGQRPQPPSDFERAIFVSTDGGILWHPTLVS